MKIYINALFSLIKKISIQISNFKRNTKRCFIQKQIKILHFRKIKGAALLFEDLEFSSYLFKKKKKNSEMSLPEFSRSPRDKYFPFLCRLTYRNATGILRSRGEYFYANKFAAEIGWYIYFVQAKYFIVIKLLWISIPVCLREME